MGRYVLCVVDSDYFDEIHKVSASFSFFAVNDLVANEIALSVFETCDDVLWDYWLWAEHNRLVATSLQTRSRIPKMDLSAIKLQQNRNILELEDALLISCACCSRSKKLAQEANHLRTMLDC